MRKFVLLPNWKKTGGNTIHTMEFYECNDFTFELVNVY